MSLGTPAGHSLKPTPKGIPEHGAYERWQRDRDQDRNRPPIKPIASSSALTLNRADSEPWTDSFVRCARPAVRGQ